MNPNFFIIRLNWVDVVTLIGFLFANVAIYSAVNNSIDLAFGWLFLAVLADAFDGVLARKFGLVRNFGRYLDSFVDCAIYLAAPCVIWYQLNYSYPLALISMLAFLCSGIIRLAVFNNVGNLEENDSLSYWGLPVFWSVFLAAAYYSLITIMPVNFLNSLLTIAIVSYAVLMLKNGSFYKPANKILMLVIILAMSLYYFYLNAFGGS